MCFVRIVQLICILENMLGGHVLLVVAILAYIYTPLYIYTNVLFLCLSKYLSCTSKTNTFSAVSGTFSTRLASPTQSLFR